MPNVQLRTPFNNVVITFVVLVWLYGVSLAVYNHIKHPLAPDGVLRKELGAIGAPNLVSELGAAQLFDRGTVVYIEKRYSTTESPVEATDFYVKEFEQHRWRLMGRMRGNDLASKFCKGHLLGTIYFQNVDSGSITYVVNIKTGGESIEVCG